MPTYAYRCPSCRHAFDVFHKISETAAQPCPKCGTVAERVITGGAGLLFKGSGFYITDYKKGTGDKRDDGAGAKDKAEKQPGATAKDAGKKSDGDASASSKKTAGDET